MEKIGIEIERKYIIKKPDINVLRAQRGFTESSIVQIYLTSDSAQTHRIRKRVCNGVTSYTETRKIRIDKISSTEIERDITAEEFDSLSQSIRAGSRPIEKTRYTFMIGQQVFELDFYPAWGQSCIMETELAKSDTVVSFPGFISVLREVTGCKEYSNSAMANAFPKEEKCL